MPVISFANPKGGAGKTTSALLLATELASRNIQITIIDADPEKWVTQWSKLPNKPVNINVISESSEDTIVDKIDFYSEKSDFLIIDLEGTASLTVAHAISMSDLVIIPTQGASMDARGAAKTIRLIKNQEKVTRRSILYTVLFTRVSAAITTRSLKNIRQQLEEASIPVMKNSLVERAAYKELLDFGGTLINLDPKKVNNIEKSIVNARAFAAETINLLKENTNV